MSDVGIYQSLTRSPIVPTDIPVIYRPIKGRLALGDPDGCTDWKPWIFHSGIGSYRPKGPGHIEVTRTALAPLAVVSVARWGRVLLIVDGHIKRACTAACQLAASPACDCSCCGRNHGARDRWRIDFGLPLPKPIALEQVDETTARGAYLLTSLDETVALLGVGAYDAITELERRQGRTYDRTRAELMGGDR